MTHPVDEYTAEQLRTLRAEHLTVHAADDLGDLRRIHAETFDDGKTCGNALEHYVLFNTRAIPR